MENMIKKIIDADNEAKSMEASTLKEREELSKQIEADAKQIYENYMNEAETTVKRNNDSEENKARKQWETAKNKLQSISIKLQSDYQKNCDKWVDEIVSRVLAQ